MGEPKKNINFTGQIVSRIQVWRNSFRAEKDRDRDRARSGRRLLRSLALATQIMDHVALDVVAPQQRSARGARYLVHSFSLPQEGCHGEGLGGSTLIQSLKSWLQAHEEAQVMVASVLVVLGLWWLVRTVLSLFINLVCPLMVVVLAVIMVPQLRAPLLGQNYSALANVLHSILIKLAENIKQE